VHQDIVRELYSEYQTNGYISENRIFDVVVGLKIPLDEIDAICELLLMKGVIIKNGNGNSDDSQYDRSQTDFELVYKEVIEIDESLAGYIKEVRNIKPPQHREWKKLFKPSQGGNAYARERIITMNMRTVVRIALWHHKKYGTPISEVIQDGNYGLVMALNKFDIRKHNNFSQYAAFWIRQIIMRHANPINPLIYYPVHFKDRIFAVMEVAETHFCNYCDDYDVCPYLTDEVITKLSCGADEAVEVLWHLVPMESIDDMLDENENAFSDNGLFAAQISDEYYGQELSKGITEILPLLNEREIEVLTLRYGLDGSEPQTLEEVGKLYDITRERIRQIESKALKKLRKSHQTKRIKVFW